MGHPSSVSDLLDRWLSAIEQEPSTYTIKEYRRLVKIDTGHPATGHRRPDED